MEKTEKLTIENVVKSINEKKGENIKLSVVLLKSREHDLRVTREIKKKFIDIMRDGIINPIHVNIIESKYRIIDGKTRVQAVMSKYEGYTKKWGDLVPIIPYNGLTVEEEDYLDAVLNSSQRELTPDEKLDYVMKYGDKWDIHELAKILSVDIKQTKEYLAVANEPIRVIRKNRVQVRDTFYISKVNTDDENVKKLLAQESFPLRDREEFGFRDVSKKFNSRKKVAGLTGESDEYIMRMEIEREHNKRINDYQSTNRYTRGSEDKPDAFERVLRNLSPENIIFSNPEDNLRYLAHNNEVVDTQVKRAHTYAQETNVRLTLLNTSIMECEKLRELFPDIEILNTSVESYILKDLASTQKRVLLYLNLNGGVRERSILSPIELFDLFTDLPNLVLLAIYGRNWYTERTREIEICNMMGHKKYRSMVIESLEQYLDGIKSKTADLGIKVDYSIEWTKNNGRDVSMVSWKSI